MPPDPSPSLAAHRAPGDVRSATSDGLVALLKEYYGRGPDEAKTYVTDDLVVCLLRGGFTRVEQTLLDGGHGGDVIRQRMAFQDVMRKRFEKVVEEAGSRHDLRGLRPRGQRRPRLGAPRGRRLVPRDERGTTWVQLPSGHRWRPARLPDRECQLPLRLPPLLGPAAVGRQPR